MVTERDNLLAALSAFYQAFVDRVDCNPSAPAIAHSHLTTSYGELREGAERHARGLTVCAPSGVPVLLFAGKTADSIACMLGCLASGRPFVWLSKRLRGPQIGDVIAASQARCLIADEAGLQSLRGAAEVDHRLRDARWLALAEVLEAGDGRSTSTGGPGAPMGCCLFTSGSTGGQRGVMVAESDLTARARSELAWYSLGAGDRLLSILPLSFDVGLNQLMSGLLAGACIVIQDSWLPADLIATITRERITGISGVPAIWRDLMGAAPALSGALRFITVSGGSLSVAEQERLGLVASGVRLFKTYGQTETFRSASLLVDAHDGRAASVGRAYPGTQVRVVRDDGSECAPGESGEVVHFGDGTMLGYLGAPRPAEQVARGVFTGDLGHLDAEGYLYLEGRRDSMVKIAGHRIYPDEVANQLRALGGVAEAEVIAASRTGGDPRLVGFAVLAGGAGWTPDAIRQAAARRLPSHMVPTEIVVLPAMPRLANGKPDRQELAALLP